MKADPVERDALLAQAEPIYAATFYLGRYQARRVVAGDVVRVPAGREHRYVAIGDRPLSAVEVHLGGALVYEEGVSSRLGTAEIRIAGAPDDSGHRTRPPALS